jgi:hypothetical protein
VFGCCHVRAHEIVFEDVDDGVHTTVASAPFPTAVEMSASVNVDAIVVASPDLRVIVSVICCVVVPHPDCVVHDCTPLLQQKHLNTMQQLSEQ